MINRPALSNKIKPDEISEFKNILLEKSIIEKIKKIKVVVRDVKDDYLIALAEKSKAHYLITGDNDLLVLKKIGRTEIIPMSEFMKLFF